MKRQMSFDNFEPPDGGWGWVIVLAAGLSNLCTFPVMQQFGLLLREKFAKIGIVCSQTTTIINLNAALSACIGLANGPLFRHFSFRQASFAGALLCSIAIIYCTIANTFIEFVISFSFFYGIAMGITTSANALALNTYFRKKRRIATGFSWTATALGPIIMPHLITAMMTIYTVEGTLLIFSGIASNAIVCACLLKPVHWHTKKEKDIENYTPTPRNSTTSATSSKLQTRRLSTISAITAHDLNYFNIQNSVEFEHARSKEITEEKSWHNKGFITDDSQDKTSTSNGKMVTENFETDRNSTWHKIVESFDLGLLTDGTFVNMMMGLTIASFAELNFSILTPFILGDFGFTKEQTAMYMSILASLDISARFLVPFVAEKIDWDNRLFYLIGVLTLALGRIILAHTQNYRIALILAIFMGLGKGLRTVFMALVIPSHVPLQRLPAATGLQLLTSGIFSIIMGPIVGQIRDATKSYVLLLHFLNTLTFITAVCWTIEIIYLKLKNCKKK